MNLLIDIGAIKTGGGAQLALNFLDLLSTSTRFNSHAVTLLVPEYGPLSSYSFDNSKFSVYRYPNNYLKRFIFETTVLPKIYRDHRITHIYTFFGAGLPKPKTIQSIVTTAYPIICYPDSQFWHYAPQKTRLKNYFNNRLRRYRLSHADKIIVETAVMRERISSQLAYDKNHIFVLPPTPSRYLQEINSTFTVPTDINFLIVSGVETHKNLWRLPEIAIHLTEKGLDCVLFTLSVSEQAFEAQPRLNKSIWAKVKQHFRFLGHVPPTQIQTVYEKASFLLNMSDLESFSNNYMEAWKAGVPLVCSDRDFARHICGDSATYVDPHSPLQAANIIYEVVGDPTRVAKQIAAGKSRLQKLGSPQDRFKRVIDIIQAAV